MLADDSLKPLFVGVCCRAQLLFTDPVCSLQVVQHVLNIMCHASWRRTLVCSHFLNCVHVCLQTQHLYGSCYSHVQCFKFKFDGQNCMWSDAPAIAIGSPYHSTTVPLNLIRNLRNAYDTMGVAKGGSWGSWDPPNPPVIIFFTMKEVVYSTVL